MPLEAKRQPATKPLPGPYGCGGSDLPIADDKNITTSSTFKSQHNPENQEPIEDPTATPLSTDDSNEDEAAVLKRLGGQRPLSTLGGPKGEGNAEKRPLTTASTTLATVTTTTIKNNNTNKTTATAKRHKHESNNNQSAGGNRKIIDCNSLESINSRFSLSSANEPTSPSGTPTSSPTPPEETSASNGEQWRPCSSSSSSSSSNAPSSAASSSPPPAAERRVPSGINCAFVETRFVPPPRVGAVSMKGCASNTELEAVVDLGNLDGKQASGGPILAAAGHRHSLECSDGRKRQGSNSAACGGCGNGGQFPIELPQVALAGANGASPGKPTTGGFGARRPVAKGPFMFAGIFASILGSIFFSFSMLCIKLLPSGDGLVEKTQAVCFRGLFIMLFCSLTMAYQGTTFKIRRDEIWVNILRCVFGFAGVYGSYISLQYISMGDATALVFSSPVWTSLLSHFILGEPLHWIQLLALPASLLGIVLIAHPALIVNMDRPAGATERQPLLQPQLHQPLQQQQQQQQQQQAQLNASLLPQFDELSSSLSLYLENQLENMTTIASTSAANGAALNSSLLQQTGNADLDVATNASESFDFEQRWPGIIIALGTSFLVSCVYIVLKFRKTTPIQTTTFWLGSVTVMAACLIMSGIGFGTMPNSVGHWSLLLGNGLCSWLGQGLLQWALMHEEASVLSVIRTLDVAMTFTLSAIFLDEEILWTSIVGATIIGLVVVSIMLNNWLCTLFANSGSIDQQKANNKSPEACQQQQQQRQLCKQSESSDIESARHKSKTRQEKC